MTRPPTPRRVLMTVDAVGGVWTYALELTAALRPLGTDVVLALLGPPANAAQRAAAAAAGAALIDLDQPLDWLAVDPGAVGTAAAAVAATARLERVDLVHLNQPALAGAGSAFDVPVVAAIHSCVATWWAAVHGTPLPDDFVWQTDLVARGLATADAVIAPSRAFAAEVVRQYRLPTPPAVVHNGRSRSTVAGEATANFAFTAGRLWDAGKDIATLDRAAGRLGVPFHAAGSRTGPHGDTLAVTHLVAPGPLDAPTLAATLATRPVFASAARYEPFGLAVLEAALAGCALVLSDIPTFRELWDGVAAFVPTGDDGGFVAAIATLIADPATREAAGDRARAHAARYDVAAMAREVAAIYDTLPRTAVRAAA